ncbi:hypothetical protein F5148DRAFT_389737 [Russula earlei]|uniref:Uncharacterized protein n=1 Tax=Russula earlei TaxID=71964 RepID=A0ACC0UHS8_9AGAM|nr:hypothetical protein F5148DRAFT_389737 [Russula earlei]
MYRAWATGALHRTYAAGSWVNPDDLLSPGRYFHPHYGPCRASLGASPCEYRQDRVTINTLPDDVLVETFHFYAIVDSSYWGIGTKEWYTLVHLRLEYTGKRPMSVMLDVWPALPVMISHGPDMSNSWENVAVALESVHRHRICQINLLDIPTSEWEGLAAAAAKTHSRS